jgi:uncharacterized protein YndB with AHSA1/START domain
MPLVSPLVLRHRYAHPRHRVFAAFSSAEALEKWLAPSGSIVTRVLEFSFRVGGHYRIAFTLPDGIQTTLFGEYLLIDEPNKLCFSWRWEAPDPHAGVVSQVTVDYLENGGATELVVTHERLDPPSMKLRHTEGWHGTLVRLASWLTASASE